MERVAFLIESTGDRLGCLLNPASLVVRRAAGVRPQQSAGGRLTGEGLSDDPLLYTRGGRTELELELLFDVSLAGSSVQTADVRDLTRPLWDLAENPSGDGGGQQALVRFVWGKAWNVRGVVSAVAERLEEFNSAGAAQRSWLRMRMWRVGEQAAAPLPAPPPPEDLQLGPADVAVPDQDVGVHQVLAGGEGGETERLDQIAVEYYGDPAYWRLLAAYNGLDDPNDIPPGTVLRIPPADAVGGGPP